MDGPTLSENDWKCRLNDYSHSPGRRVVSADGCFLPRFFRRVSSPAFLGFTLFGSATTRLFLFSINQGKDSR
jgi:hypothetical protein